MPGHPPNKPDPARVSSPTPWRIGGDFSFLEVVRNGPAPVGSSTETDGGSGPRPTTPARHNDGVAIIMPTLNEQSASLVPPMGGRDHANLIAATVMPLAFAIVTALAVPATAYPCAEFVGKWLEQIEAKGDALQGLHDARVEADDAWHVHYTQRNRLNQFVFENVTIVVAKAMDEQTKTGSETLNYENVGKAIIDQFDALDAVLDAEQDAHTALMGTQTEVLRARNAAHPYLKRLTAVDAAVLDMIECFRERS